MCISFQLYYELLAAHLDSRRSGLKVCEIGVDVDPEKVMEDLTIGKKNLTKLKLSRANNGSIFAIWLWDPKF